MRILVALACAAVAGASTSAQHVSNVPNLVVNGDFEASQFSIAPWFSDYIRSARLTMADLNGDGQPSQGFEFSAGGGGSPFIAQFLPLRIGGTYTVFFATGYKRVASELLQSEIRSGVCLDLHMNPMGAYTDSAREIGARVSGAYSGVLSGGCATEAYLKLSMPLPINSFVALVDDIEMREVRDGSLRINSALLRDRGLASAQSTNPLHSVEVDVNAGMGNPAVLLASPATANLTLPGLIGEVLVDPALAVAVDVATNPIGDALILGVVIPNSAIPPGLPALYWQAFSYDVAANVARATDVALRWSYQR